jgi:hypothetical protein
MSTITIHKAKTNLSKYIELAKQGQVISLGAFGVEEVILTTRSNTQQTSLSDKRKSAMGNLKATKVDYKVLEGIDEDVQMMFYGELGE